MPQGCCQTLMGEVFVLSISVWPLLLEIGLGSGERQIADQILPPQ